MDAVIRRSLEKGIGMITIGTQLDTSQKALEIAETYDGLWATVGMHPSHLCAQEFVDDEELDPSLQQTICSKGHTFDPKDFLPLAKHPKCVAIGECGLDYYHIPENVNREEVIAKQKQTLREQLDLASQVELPVVIHCRDAHEDQLEILQEYEKQGKLIKHGVAHCFTGTLQQAQDYLALGFLVSFTGIITFPPRKKDVLPNGLSPLQEVVRQLPLESFMVETDAPYLSPEPFRGERNEPWRAEYVAKKIAEIKNISFEEVCEATTQNAKKLFGIYLPHG
jgi:TatD DNase family protein